MNTRFTLLLILLSINIFAQKDINSILFGGSDNEYTFDHCFDVDGNVVLNNSLNTNVNQSSVDVSKLIDGVYFVSIGEQTQKFIKQ